MSYCRAVLISSQAECGAWLVQVIVTCSGPRSVFSQPRQPRIELRGRLANKKMRIEDLWDETSIQSELEL
eukprot:COSAG01_NODE_14016_length_1507_cov_1.372869_1_plen_70_part_00